MLIAAAVCPHPPLLVPEVLGAAAADPPAGLRQVLAACDQAVKAVLAADLDLLVVVGGGPETAEFGASAAGSLAPYGVPVTVGPGEPVLPLSLTVGRWLLERAGLAICAPPGEGSVVLQAVRRDASPPQCRRLGETLAGRAPRVGVLAMGDACARRAQAAPGAPDPQAQEYDDEVAEALAAVDARWLGSLSPALDGELAVAGRAAWQVLAGAAGGGQLQGRLLCMAAPFEVTYLVAVWEDSRQR